VAGEVSIGWVDLAANHAGKAVQAEAEAARRAHPWKTALGELFGVQTAAAACAKGCKGEQLVAKQLATLGSPWEILHSIPIGTKETDIDHLVIGPGGVFSLNAKNHLGKRVWVHTEVVKVNGQTRDYPRVSEHEARHASRLLSGACGFPVAVTGVVVVLASALHFGSHPTRTPVVGRKEIARWLRAQPPVLDAATVASIYAVARQSTTWT
jgi:nuclease-like protein